MDHLSRSCSTEYGIAVDYFSLSASQKADGARQSCEELMELLDYGISIEAIRLVAEDGLCSSDGTPAEETVSVDTKPGAAEEKWPEGGLGWDEARTHAGTVQRVCGPVATVRETEDGTFINVGMDYPSADRFTFIFWDTYLDEFDTNSTVCGTGEIYLYDGVVAQMEMTDPTSLEIWS